MKKLMFSMALTALLAGTATAQDARMNAPADRARVQTERMVKDLGLSDEQKTKVEAINLKYAEKAQALRAERKAEPGEHKGEGKELMAERENEMKSVLTPEQFEKWNAQEKARIEKRKEQVQERRSATPKAAPSDK